MTALSVHQFWDGYLATLPPDSPIRRASYDVEAFGDSPEMREARRGAGGSLLAGQDQCAKSPLPRVAQHTLVLGAEEQPLCIMETTEVRVRPFQEVDAEFAAAEGEGDRSLDSWRREHWRFFTRSLAAIGRAPTEEMPLVCERFRVVHRQRSGSLRPREEGSTIAVLKSPRPAQE